MVGLRGAGADRIVRTEADRVDMEVLMVVVGHVDTALEGVEHPMSSFLHFLFLLCPDLLSLSWVKGLQFSQFFIFSS